MLGVWTEVAALQNRDAVKLGSLFDGVGGLNIEPDYGGGV